MTPVQQIETKLLVDILHDIYKSQTLVMLQTTWRQWFFVYSALSLHFDGFCNFSSVQNIDELFVQLVHNWRVYFMVITNHLASLKLAVLMHFNNQEFWDHKTWKYNCMNPIQNVSYSLKICKGHAYQHRSAHDIVINRSLFSKN